MAAGRVHGPEPEVGDWNRAAKAQEQDSDRDSDLDSGLDSRDRSALLQ